jgi:hypothetical protein
MKVSLLAVAHLSLYASAAESRLRRLKPDPSANELRNMLLHVRDIDGTAVIDGPEGATARLPENAMSSPSGLSAKASKYPVTTAPPEVAAAVEENDATAIVTSVISLEDSTETTEEASTTNESTSNEKMTKSGKSEASLSMAETVMSVESKSSKDHHQDKESKAGKEADMSAPLAKSDKSPAAKTSKEPGTSMDYESKDAPLSMDSKAAKSDSKAQKDALSMPVAKTMKEEAAEFWIEYEAEHPIVDAKSEKNVSLSMDSKAGKSERKVDLETLSMPAGKTTKEDVIEMSLAKAEKVMSVDSKAAKSENKADLESLSVPAGKASKEKTTDMSIAKSEKNLSMESKAEKIALSMDSKAAKDHTATMTITEEFVSTLPHEAKASKVLSMETHRLFPKSGKTHSLSM